MTGSPLIPAEPDHLKILVEVYLLEKAFYALSEELKHRTEYAQIPLKIIRSVLED
jgi:predicted trehalose synthase